MTCPCCSGADVHRSRRRGVLDKIQSWRGLWPYRCLVCDERFFVAARYPAFAEGASVRLNVSLPQYIAPTASASYVEIPSQMEDALLALHAAVYSHESETAAADAEMVNTARDPAKMPVAHKVTR